MITPALPIAVARNARQRNFVVIGIIRENPGQAFFRTALGQFQSLSKEELPKFLDRSLFHVFFWAPKGVLLWHFCLLFLWISPSWRQRFVKSLPTSLYKGRKFPSFPKTGERRFFPPRPTQRRKFNFYDLTSVSLIDNYVIWELQ